MAGFSNRWWPPIKSFRSTLSGKVVCTILTQKALFCGTAGSTRWAWITATTGCAGMLGWAGTGGVKLTAGMATLAGCSTPGVADSINHR